MKINFVPCDFLDIEEFVDEYEASLASPIDSFLEDHVMDFRKCLILWSVLSFFVSRALAQLWNALAGQVQMVQFSDFAVLFTPHCVYHPEWFQIKI